MGVTVYVIVTFCFRVCRSGMTFCSSILPELFDVMRPSQVIDVSAIDDDAEAKRLREAPKHFISALRSLTSAPSLKADRLAAKDVANQIMVDSHHPVIGELDGGGCVGSFSAKQRYLFSWKLIASWSDRCAGFISVRH